MVSPEGVLLVETLRLYLDAPVSLDVTSSQSLVCIPKFASMLDPQTQPLCLCWHVARAGTQVIIPYREEDNKRHLKVTGDLGQIVSMVRHLGSASGVEIRLRDSLFGLGRFRSGTFEVRSKSPSV